MRRILNAIFLLIIIGSLGAVVRGKYYAHAAPCSQPVTYAITRLDSGFDLSSTQLQSALDDAEKIWEGPTGKNLFQRAQEGNVSVQLIYDSRQQATERLQSLGLQIDSSRSAFDRLKSTHTTYDANYKNKLTSYNAKVSKFNARKEAYEKQVDYWNNKGGAPEAEYKKMNAEQNQLQAEATTLNNEQDSINELVATLNALASEMNRMAAQLNLNVERYNTIGASNGEEFQEGIYASDEKGERIEIYQFENRDQLIRVLAHELGHALGLDHVEDKDAIMYRLNESENSVATTADLNELTTICSQKPESIFDTLKNNAYSLFK